MILKKRPREGTRKEERKINMIKNNETNAINTLCQTMAVGSMDIFLPRIPVKPKIRMIK
jgi:hypothetical protein